MNKCYRKTIFALALRISIILFVLTGCETANYEFATNSPISTLSITEVGMLRTQTAPTVIAHLTQTVQAITSTTPTPIVKTVGCELNQEIFLSGYKENVPNTSLLHDEMILSGSGTSGIVTLDPKTGTSTRLEQEGIVPYYSPEANIVFPNTTWIAYNYKNGFATLNILTGEKTIFSLGESYIQSMAWALDNQHLFMVVSCGMDSPPYLVSLNVETNIYKVLRSMPDSEIISVSPNLQSFLRYAKMPYSHRYFGGSYIAVPLVIDDISGRDKPIVFADDGVYEFWADFMPDGKSVLVMGMDVDIYYSSPTKYSSCAPYFQPHRVYLVNLETGKHREYHLPVNVINDKPLLSPDGSKLLYEDVGDFVGADGGNSCRENNFPFYILNLKTGESTPLEIEGHNPAWSPDGSQIAFLHMDKREQFLSIYDLSLNEIIATYSNNVIKSINSQLYWIMLESE